ncbi:MAG: DinB family protein [Candidatus Eisenbacteria bacterium]|nr:DinB family protein [Candidatus Eisenbacteria bacterium]
MTAKAPASPGKPRPEVWLRGPVPELPPALQPVAHSLLQVREDLPPLLASLSDERIWARPGGSASIGYHAAHLAGSLVRLATYARGESLSAAQLADLEAERNVDAARPERAELVRRVNEAIESVLHDLSTYFEDDLFTPREVGRAKLPSTVIGLLSHAAEHTARHAGQIATLVRVTSASSGG